MKSRRRNYAASAVFMVVGIALMSWLVSWVAAGFDLSDTAVMLIAVFGGLVVAVCTGTLFYELEERRERLEREAVSHFIANDPFLNGRWDR